MINCVEAGLAQAQSSVEGDEKDGRMRVDEKTLLEKFFGEEKYFPRDAWSVKDASDKKRR